MTLIEKPKETSAAATAFCAAKLEGPTGHLWIDGNGKITAGNGTLDEPKPNAFSLVQIADCPGSTSVCRESCYVHGLEKHAPATHALYKHNSAEIRRILALDDTYGGAPLWAVAMANWITMNCEGGFRWHVSGDIFSLSYAQWIADVCAASPRVGHWIYTRSFEYIEQLLKVSTTRGGNLAINLSCDRDNYEQAAELAKLYGLRLCYLTSDGNVPEDLRDGDVIFPDYGLRGGTPKGRAWFEALSPDYKSYICPVDYHGKSERRRCGPCGRCMT